MGDISDLTKLELLENQRDWYHKSALELREFLFERGLHEEYEHWSISRMVIKRMEDT